MRVYLNNAATGYPKTELSIKACNECLRALPTGTRHGNNNSNKFLEKSREIVAGCLGIRKSFVFFSSGSTLAINQIIRGYLNNGDHCICDNRAHNATIRTLHDCKNIKYEICNLYNVHDAMNFINLVKRIKSNTTLICLTHVSNVSGSIYNVSYILNLIKSRFQNVAVMIDASQAAGTVDLKNVACSDFVVFSSHKHLHSVPGAAVVICRRQLTPYIMGGTGHNGSGLNMETYSLFFEVGTMNIPAIYALAISLQDYEKNHAFYNEKERSTTKILIDGIKNIKGLEIIGKSGLKDRIGIVSCKTIYGSPEIEWIPYLLKQKIIVRGGLHCSPIHHKQLNLLNIGTLRFSISRFTTIKEIEFTLQILKQFSVILENLW